MNFLGILENIHHKHFILYSLYYELLGFQLCNFATFVFQHFPLILQLLLLYDQAFTVELCLLKVTNRHIINNGVLNEVTQSYLGFGKPLF